MKNRASEKSGAFLVYVETFELEVINYGIKSAENTAFILI